VGTDQNSYKDLLVIFKFWAIPSGRGIIKIYLKSHFKNTFYKFMRRFYMKPNGPLVHERTNTEVEFESIGIFRERPTNDDTKIQTRFRYIQFFSCQQVQIFTHCVHLS